MNNQNTESHNQSWRQPNYIEDSRNLSLSRAQNCFPHYSSHQFVNNYMPTGYVYPTMMPPFRTTQYQAPPMSEQYYQSLGFGSPQMLSKYYSKGIGYNPQDLHLHTKDNSLPHNLFGLPPKFRNSMSLGSIGAPNIGGIPNSQMPVSMQLPYINDQAMRGQKGNRNKSIIVIESDEQNQNQQNLIHPPKIVSQKLEQKQAKQASKIIERQDKKKQITLEPRKEIQQTIVASQVFPIQIDNQVSQKQQNIKQKTIQIFYPHNKRGRPQYIQQNFNETYKNITFQNKIISFSQFEKQKNRLIQQVQKTQFPDYLAKIFLIYKIYKIGQNYQSKQPDCHKFLEQLKICRGILTFQIEKKNLLKELFKDKLLLQGTNLFKNIQLINQTNQQSQRNNSQNKNFLSRYFDNSIQTLNSQQQKIYQRSSIGFQSKSNQNNQKKQRNKLQNKNVSNLQDQYIPFNLPSKTKKISKKQLSDQNSQEVSFNAKNKYLQKYDLQPQNSICDRRLRDRKKKKNKKDKYQRSQASKLVQKTLSQKDKDKDKQQNSKTDKQATQKQNPKQYVELSHQDEGLIQKIKGWAQKTVLADAISEKHKKSKSTFSNQIKGDPFRVIKKEDNNVPSNMNSNQGRKIKQRSNKITQSAFRQLLAKNIMQLKAAKQQYLQPNLITFTTSNNISQEQKQEFQKQLTQLIKQMRNNESHGKIRIGKEYYQAKMPNFIRSQRELQQMMRQKRAKLMQRKMTVLTF